MIHKVVKHKLSKWQSFKNVSVGKTTVGDESNPIYIRGAHKAHAKCSLRLHAKHFAVHFSIQLNMQYCPSEGQESVHKHRQLHLLPFMKELIRKKKTCGPSYPIAVYHAPTVFSSFKMESVIYFSAKRNVCEEC